MIGILTLPENNIVSEINVEEVENQQKIYNQLCEIISSETLDCKSIDQIEDQYHLIMYSDDYGYEKKLSFNEIASLLYSNGNEKQCIRGPVVFMVKHIITGIIASLDIKNFKNYLQKRKLF